ncbi:MAG: nucleoside hydrolase [Schleiferilactobacillus harbinensis]
MSTPVIISTDPGIDDAVAIAIALADPQLDVQLICPVAGNVSLVHTTDNTRKLLTLLHQTVRIVPGSQRPLLRLPINAGNIHGVSGLAGYDFPAPTVPVDTTTTAAAAMHAVVSQQRDKTTLVAIGPLTDIALYLHQYPADRARIDQLVLMGGAIGRGNWGVLSEFNFAADPEAADIVFRSGVKIKMAPLEVGTQAKIMPAVTAQIRQLGTVGDMFYHLFTHYRGGSIQTGLKIYDALAIALLTQPDLFTLAATNVTIETQGTYTAGASLVDLQDRLHERPNAQVATAVNASRFTDWFVRALTQTK